MIETAQRYAADAGVNDPHKRLTNMDGDYTAAEVIFHGGNASLGSEIHLFRPESSGPGGYVGIQLYNRWLLDYCSVAPDRLLGVAVIPYWDVEACIREAHWAIDHGMRCINLPGIRPGIVTYDSPLWEPFWDLCESNNVILHSHGGFVSSPEMLVSGPAGASIFMSQNHYLGRRHFAYLIFAGILERHPGLKIVLSEQRAHWILDQLNEWEQLYDTPQNRLIKDVLPRRPSEYFRANFFLGTSFLAHFEAAMRHEIGMEMMGWGRDYPHTEGTWPHTLETIRWALWDVPEGEVRQILGENAIRFYGLDREPLEAVASKIGPTPQEVSGTSGPYPGWLLEPCLPRVGHVYDNGKPALDRRRRLHYCLDRRRFSRVSVT